MKHLNTILMVGILMSAGWCRQAQAVPVGFNYTATVIQADTARPGSDTSDWISAGQSFSGAFGFDSNGPDVANSDWITGEDFDSTFGEYWDGVYFSGFGFSYTEGFLQAIVMDGASDQLILQNPYSGTAIQFGDSSGSVFNDDALPDSATDWSMFFDSDLDSAYVYFYGYIESCQDFLGYVAKIDWVDCTIGSDSSGQPVPEPATLILLAGGAAMLAGAKKRKR